MYKIVTDKGDIFCDSYEKAGLGLMINNIYSCNKISISSDHYESFSYFEFSIKSKERLIYNPHDVIIEEFDSELFCKVNLIVELCSRIMIESNSIEIRTEMVNFRKDYLTKHSDKWYSFILKRKLDRTKVSLEISQSIIKEKQELVNTLERIKGLNTFDEMIYELKNMED